MVDVSENSNWFLHIL